jgi:hypothetical protein
MRDLRRQVLESGKTVSRKAQSKISSRASSAHASVASSRNVSRHGSDEEDAELSDSTAWRYVSDFWSPLKTTPHIISV